MATSKSRSVIINVCLTGMIPTRDDTPYVPITADEIATSAIACAETGAAMVHLHARGPDSKPTWQKEVYARMIGLIRNKAEDLVIVVSTGGRNWSDFEKRSNVLDLKGDLKPDMASLTLGSMNFIKDASMNPPQVIQDLASKMLDTGIKPEIEAFEPGMVHKANYLIKKGYIPACRPYFNIFLGSLGSSPLDPTCFAAFYNLLPNTAIWSLAGLGRYQFDANLLALAFDGHIRTGIEDNIYLDRDRKELASNERMVYRMARIIEDCGKKVACPSEARRILELKRD